jgi:fumarate reductase subunit C
MVTQTDIKPHRMPRTAAYLDVGEMLSGVLLVIFMIAHLLLVATIIIGPEAFRALAIWLEETFYFAYIAVVGVILLIGAHVVLAVSKIPTNWNKHAKILSMSRSMPHLDTFLWIVQVVTGLLIAFFASVHLWMISTTFPITPEQSSARVYGQFTWFYIIAVFVVEVHLSVGFYRIVAKWGLWSRKFMHWFHYLQMLIFWAIGYYALYRFYQLGAEAASAAAGGGV